MYELKILPLKSRPGNCFFHDKTFSLCIHFYTVYMQYFNSMNINAKMLAFKKCFKELCGP